MDLLKGLRIPSNEMVGEIRFESVCFSYPSRPDQVNCRTIYVRRIVIEDKKSDRRLC